MKGPRLARVTALAAAVAVLATACTGEPGPLPTGSPERPPTSTPPQPAAAQGGSVVLGTDWGPGQCLNPIKDCVNQGAWHTILEHVLPRAMELDPQGRYVASPLLAEVPTLENGGLRTGPSLSVAFRIREGAVWNDETPITSEDFAFTWKAILHTRRSLQASEYRLIRSIDSSDPGTAVISFSEVTARWAEFFGGARGFILKRSAFPRADPSKPDLRLAMWDSIRFSGGPWVFRSWSRWTDEVTLARNERYFGRKPNFDQVTFMTGLAKAGHVSLVAAGTVSAISVHPLYGPDADATFLHRVDQNPDIFASVEGGTRVEAIWFNSRAGALKDPRVREALMYALDRQAVVDAILRLGSPDARVLNCGLTAFPNGPWCRTEPFARFAYDPLRARSVLERAGYDCSFHTCHKAGKPLVIRYQTDATNGIRTAAFEILHAKASLAGIELEFAGYECGLCFTSGPARDFHIAQYPIRGIGDPSVTGRFSCEQIWTGHSDPTGENFFNWCNLEADRLMKESDTELDPTRRQALMDRIYELQARDFIGLPLFVEPVANVWRTDQIAGPIGRYASSLYGLFFNMNEWHRP